MSTPRLGFVDVMKCLGMALIVFGHVGGALTADRTPPILVKQLGVAFFMFVTGFTLAREQRPTAEVVYRRLFEVVFFGVAFAALMSGITYVRTGDLAESNYLPFLLGANVAMNAFPANPTTWFIGSYIHTLLVWAIVLRSRRVGRTWLVIAALAEVAIRVGIMAQGQNYIAYMFLANWATVFSAGLYASEHHVKESSTRSGLAWAITGLGVMTVVWPFLAWRVFDPAPGFPFMTFRVGPRIADLGLTSVSVTLAYLVFTLCTYRLSQPLGAPAWVVFFSRNTPLIFIAHMPIYYGLSEPLVSLGLPYGLRVAVLFLVGFIGPAVVSEGVRRGLELSGLRDRIWFRMTQKAAGVVAVDRGTP